MYGTARVHQKKVNHVSKFRFATNTWINLSLYWRTDQETRSFRKWRAANECHRKVKDNGWAWFRFWAIASLPESVFVWAVRRRSDFGIFHNDSCLIGRAKRYNPLECNVLQNEKKEKETKLIYLSLLISPESLRSLLVLGINARTRWNNLKGQVLCLCLSCFV